MKFTGRGGIEYPVFDLLTYNDPKGYKARRMSKLVLKPPLTTCCPSHYFLKFCCLPIVGSFVLFANVPSCAL